MIFGLLSNFLYDTVKEDDIEYPAHLTWIDNVVCGKDDDLYAARLLFLLTCSKCVRDDTLSSLEQFVNNGNFSVDYVIGLGEDGLKEVIQHLGLGNKNATDLLGMFQEIKLYMDEHGYFPRTVPELRIHNGVGTKIASLVLYFAYGQIKAISVDSHVVKCATALQWIPLFCTTPDAVGLALQQWIPLHFWLHANMILALYGQMFSTEEKARKVRNIASRDFSASRELLPLIDAMLTAYQPTLVKGL